jgi:transcriptional regulator with XRE-family HTH domain
MARADGIGLNLARRRIVAGMTQAQLARAAGFSAAYISMIESGGRLVENRRTLDTLARALGISSTDLTGQPYPVSNRADLTLYRAVPRIRAALDDPDDGPVVPRPLAELEVATDLSLAARMHCDMAALSQHLPGVLAETRFLWLERGDRKAGELFIKAAVTGSLALKAGGWVGDSIRMAELADNVASVHGDPVCVAFAQFAVAQNALTVGSRRRSARVAIAGATELDRLTRVGKLPKKVLNDVYAMMGMLQLHAALAESTLDDGDPSAHLAAADDLARHVTGDPLRMEFGRANVGVWRVGIALENGHPDQGPALARRVDVNQLRTPQRKSRLWLDAGRAAFASGHLDDAVRYLTLADRAAPGDLRQRATAVEIVGNLVRTAHGSDQLSALAVAVGVDPADPDATVRT